MEERVKPRSRMRVGRGVCTKVLGRFGGRLGVWLVIEGPRFFKGRARIRVWTRGT